MNRSIIFLAGFVALFWIVSCDKLDEPYAVKKTGGDTITGPVRKVLLEDYTGHKCVNCPKAAMDARIMEEALGGRLIIMAVHAGYFAEPASTGEFTADYTTAAGDEWNTWYNITANPNGLVNRVPYNGSVVIGPDLWINAVNGQLALPQEAEIEIENDYDSPSRMLEITVHTKFMALLEGTYNLTICLTEDSLVSPQKNSDSIAGTVPVIENYVFMDVLRGAVNGTWGEELTSAVDTTLSYHKTYTATLDPAWTAKNCHVVAFISKAETKGIIQAEKKAVLSE